MKHKKTHTIKKAAPCDICGKILNTSWTLLRHKQSRHGQVFPYQCKLCQKRFKVELTLKRHMRVHGDPSFFCKVCEIVTLYFQLEKIEPDMYTSLPYSCGFCLYM